MINHFCVMCECSFVTNMLNEIGFCPIKIFFFKDVSTPKSIFHLKIKKNFQHTIINETFLFMVIMIWKNEYFNIIFVDFIGLQKTCGLIRYFPKSYFRQNNVLKIRKFDCLLEGVDLSTNSFFFRRV